MGPTKTTSRQPLHFHVARLSAAPQVLHASRLPQSGHRLTLRNLVNRSTKLDSDVVAKLSDSCFGDIGVKSVIGNVNTLGSVPSECGEPASPDNPFNSLRPLYDSSIELADSQSNPVGGHSTDFIQTALCSSNEVVKTDIFPFDHSYSTHSPNLYPQQNSLRRHNHLKPLPSPNSQKSRLSHSQRVKLLKLRFLEMYPPAMTSAMPPPIPPKPTRPVSCESEGYWSASMASLASLNLLDLTEFNRNFETQLGQLEFSPLLRDPMTWDSACIDNCRQRLDKELTHIEYLLEEIECEEFELREQLLDLLPSVQDEGGDGEETMVEESANYLDREISILQFGDLDVTEDNQAVESSKSNQLVPKERNINVSVLFDAGENVEKTPANALLDDIDQNIGSENSAIIGSVLDCSHEVLVSADAHFKGIGFIPESDSECCKIGFVGGVDTTVEFIDTSFVMSDQQKDDAFKVQKDNIATGDESVCNVRHEDDATNDEKDDGKFVDKLVAGQKIDQCEDAAKSLTEVKFFNTDKEEFRNVKTRCIASNEFDIGHEKFNVEATSISDSDSFEMEIIADTEDDFSAGNGLMADIISISNEEVIDSDISDEYAKDVNDNTICDKTFTLENVNIDDENHGTENTNDKIVDDDNFLCCIDTKVAGETKLEHCLGASFQPDEIGIPYLEGLIQMSGASGEPRCESPVFNGSIRNWPSLEKGMSSIPELGYAFNIDECFPDPVRPLQYDDEEYIRKPFRRSRAYRPSDDEHEEKVVGVTRCHLLEEGAVDTTESEEPADNELHGLMDDGSEDEYFVDEVSFEQFEKEISIFFSAMNDAKECQSEYDGTAQKCNNEKTKSTLGDESDDGSLKDRVVSVGLGFANDCNNEEFASVTQNSKNDKCLTITGENLERDPQCDDNIIVHSDCLVSAHVKSTEVYQEKMGNNDVKLAEPELPNNHRLTNTMKEGLAANLVVLNIIEDVLANIFGATNTESDRSKVDMQAVNMDEEKPKQSVEVDDFELRKYNGKEDGTNLEDGASAHEEEVNFLENYFEADDISDHSFDADRSSSDNEPDISETENFPNSLNFRAEIATSAPGSPRCMSVESGAGIASPLFDPLDLEMRRLNGSFIPIEVGGCETQRYTQPLPRSCCFHYLSTSSDTGSTNEETDVTSPSDAEYEAGMPATLEAQLSPRCRNVLDTPLHYSFHIRDENDESLELPASPHANAEEAAAVPVVSQGGAFAYTLQKAIEEIEIIGEAETGDRVGSGFHWQEETPEEIKPVTSWNDCSADIVEIKEELFSFAEPKPELEYFEDANVGDGDFSAGPLALSNIPRATSEVFASSWQAGRLWSMISYTEYEPIGNSTTTSQLDAETVSDMNSVDATAGDLTEADERSSATSPFISCGSDSQSALSSQFVLSSPDIYFDSQGGDLQDQLSQSTGETGDDTQHSAFSRSSKDGSPTKDLSTEDSPKKDKKKKKGLRTPSFLKKKKEKKKMAEA